MSKPLIDDSPAVIEVSFNHFEFTAKYRLSCSRAFASNSVESPKTTIILNLVIF